MLQRSLRIVLPVLGLLGLLAPAALASGGTAASGGSAYQAPGVTELRCGGSGDASSCARGQILRLSGSGLASTSVVRFAGGASVRKTRTARPLARSPHRVLVRIPSGARTGAVTAVTRAGRLTGPSVTVLPAPAADSATTRTIAAGPDGAVFPLRGKHTYGTAVNGFGGGRGHQGQDVLSACGLPVVAAISGTVHMSTFQSAAGNYVVIDDAAGASQAYMHLRDPSPLKAGDTVIAGQKIGVVGSTGRASTCHLHFEYWTAPGWYQGGSPVDPRPLLKAWDAGQAAPAIAASRRS